MRSVPALLIPCLAALAVSCRTVIFEVHPCDNLASKVEEAVCFSRSNPGSDVRVLLTGGIYRLDRPIRIDGTGGPFTIGTAGGARPLIAGDIDIKGWRPSSIGDGILEAFFGPDTDLGSVVSDSNRVDFYACDVRQTLARWPNGDEFTYAGRCLDAPLCDKGVLEYKDPEIAGWADENDPYLLGYWHWDWYESYKSISSIDTSACHFTVDPLNDLYGYKDGCRFFGLNLLCELDEEGEYYIDRTAGKIYWMAPEGFFERKHPTTRLSLLSGTDVISARNCDRLVVRGLEFRGFRDGVISLKNCSGSSVADCYIHCIGETAIKVDGGRSNSVRKCKFAQLGKMAVIASGGDRKTLEPSGFKVVGCSFSDFALFGHTYNPAINFTGVGALIRGCSFCHSTSSAIITGGNDIVIERCTFSDLVCESDDQGAIESFGDYSFRRCIVRFNRFEDICKGTNCGSSAVRFDDLISGNEVYGNVFKNCGILKFGAVQIHGGRDNRVHHNLFVDCNYSISCSLWTMDYFRSSWEKFKPRWSGIDLTGEPYSSRYPELLEPTDSLNLNRNYFYGNLSLRSGEESFRGDCLLKKGNISLK